MQAKELLGRITINPKIFGGKPIIRGMRIKVDTYWLLWNKSGRKKY